MSGMQTCGWVLLILLFMVFAVEVGAQGAAAGVSGKAAKAVESEKEELAEPYFGGRIAIEQRVNALTYMQKVVTEANKMLKSRIEMVGEYLEMTGGAGGYARFVVENKEAFKGREEKQGLGFEDAKAVAEEHIGRLQETKQLGDYSAVLERDGGSDSFLTYDQGVEVAKDLSTAKDTSKITTEILLRHAESLEKIMRDKWAEARLHRHHQDMMRAYLMKIEKFDDYMDWAIERVLEIQTQDAADLAALRADLGKKKEKRETEQQQLAAQRRAEKAEAQRIELARKFELRQQQMESETRVREANAASRNSSWGGWGGAYRDVYRTPRVYPVRP